MSQLENLLQQCTVKLTLPGRTGQGTGFFVAPGWILTCNHVVSGSASQPADLDQRVIVQWQTNENYVEALVQQSLPAYDLALLRFEPSSLSNPPCVYLNEDFSAGHALYAYGYSDEFPEGASLLGECEGDATENNSRLILFKATRVRSGMSGAPLLNQRTGKVCGMVKFTRDRSFDLGGGAVPTSVILAQFPELVEQQRLFHHYDRRWNTLVVKPSDIDFQPYLTAIATTYEKWWQFYTLTDAEGKQRQSKEVAPIFDFGTSIYISGGIFNAPVNLSPNQGHQPTTIIDTSNKYSENACYSFASIHMSLGGQHQGWGGTDEITVNLQNEGFCLVQLMRCSVHWKTVDGSIRYELKSNMQIRWIQKTPWQDGSDNFAIPKMLKPGYVIQLSFNLTPQDIQASGIDTSKYVESLGNELMASSLIYEAFAEVRTESNHAMSGSISFFYPRDRDKRLSVLLE